jgi:hypothetical protein
MKTLIAAISFVVATAWVSASRAEPETAEQTWNSATLTWNRVALEAVARAKPTQHQAARLLAHLSLAQHAAVIDAGDAEAVRDAVATASMRVISDLLPSQAAFAEERHRQLGARGGDQGHRVARRVLAQANQDGFAQKWSGQVPQTENAWRSLANPTAPPAYPAIGTMRTFFLASGSALRPAPPPEVGSRRFADDLAEVRRHTQSPTEESTRIAKFYDMTTGTMAAGFWNERAGELMGSDSLDERQATTILVTVNTAMMDALVACHDAKYAYWVARPSQADPSIKPLIGVPNHPSYPSNHSCLSTAAGHVLAHFFPQDRGRLEGIAREAGMSRIYAGLHFGFDVDAGEEIGRKVAAVAVARHADMLARWTQTSVGALDDDPSGQRN